jgi:predicted transcriptional regulator of viral defense system
MTNINEKLEDALPNIIKSLDKSRRAILTRSEMQQLVAGNAEEWSLNQRSITTARVINFLWEKQHLKEYVFEFPTRKETRYVIGDITNFELAQSLKPNAYIAHQAAMYINKLTNSSPKTIHINVEQAKHHPRNKGSLTQEGIDRAFKNKVRISNEIAEANKVRVCITHGQKTDDLGIVKKKGPSGELLRVTNVERTLIDIARRPIYAGGIKEALSAYKTAKPLVSIEKLVSTLKAMDYVYPYHQSIGFYMEKSGAYDKTQIQLLKDLPKNFNFYLDYKMADPNYSEEWKLFYPKKL